MERANDASRLLRERTRQAHLRTEGASALQALASGQISALAYGDVIWRFHAVFEAIVRALDAKPYAAEALGACRARDHLSFLVCDLRAVGREPAPRFSFETASNAARAWGALYVLEGSRMGATLIRQRLVSNGHDVSKQGYAYFRAAAADAKVEFEAFSRALDRALTDPHHVNDAIESAIETFGFVRLCFEDPMHV